jgi:hypothetical protein
MPNRAKQATNTNSTHHARRREAAVRIGELVVPVPDVPPEDAGPGDAESLALAAHPGVQRLIEEGRRNFAAGRGLDPEQLYAEVGYTPPSRRPTGHRADAAAASGKLQLRLPRSVHRDVIARAAEEGVSVNQLLVSYVSRGLGQDEGASRTTAQP